MDSQLNNVSDFNTTNEQVINENNIESKIPFIQKFVFFIVGFSMSFVSLAIWFLFSDEKKYADKLKYMKNGAITSLILIVASFVVGFLVGSCGYFIN